MASSCILCRANTSTSTSWILVCPLSLSFRPRTVFSHGPSRLVLPRVVTSLTLGTNTSSGSDSFCESRDGVRYKPTTGADRYHHQYLTRRPSCFGILHSGCPRMTCSESSSLVFQIDNWVRTVYGFHTVCNFDPTHRHLHQIFLPPC